MDEYDTLPDDSRPMSTLQKLMTPSPLASRLVWGAVAVAGVVAGLVGAYEYGQINAAENARPAVVQAQAQAPAAATQCIAAAKELMDRQNEASRVSHLSQYLRPEDGIEAMWGHRLVAADPQRGIQLCSVMVRTTPWKPGMETQTGEMLYEVQNLRNGRFSLGKSEWAR